MHKKVRSCTFVDISTYLNGWIELITALHKGCVHGMAYFVREKRIEDKAYTNKTRLGKTHWYSVGLPPYRLQCKERVNDIFCMVEASLLRMCNNLSVVFS